MLTNLETYGLISFTSYPFSYSRDNACLLHSRKARVNTSLLDFLKHKVWILNIGLWLCSPRVWTQKDFLKHFPITQLCKNVFYEILEQANKVFETIGKLITLDPTIKILGSSFLSFNFKVIWRHWVFKNVLGFLIFSHYL